MLAVRYRIVLILPKSGADGISASACHAGWESAVTQRVPVRFLIAGRRDDSEHFSLLFADEFVERDRLLPVLGEGRIDCAGCRSPGGFGHDMVDMVGPGYRGVSVGSSGPDSQAFSPACLADRCAPFTGVLSGHAPGHD